MADRLRHPRRPDQFFPDQAAQLSRLPFQHLPERSARLHAGHDPADRAHLSLLSGLPHPARGPRGVDLRLHIIAYGGDDPVLHHLLDRDDGLLDPRNLDDRLHRLLLRILPWRPDVSGPHHATRSPDAAEVAAVLLRALLSNRDLPRSAASRADARSARDSD